MAAVHQTIGSVLCSWDDNTPLTWEMVEDDSHRKDGRVVKFRFDLQKLDDKYTREFLLNLRDLIISRRKRVALVTVKSEYTKIWPILLRLQQAGVLDAPVAYIDPPLLLALHSALGDEAIRALETIRRLFLRYRESPLFSPELVPGDFPSNLDSKGHKGGVQARILTQALSRAACVEVLRCLDEAYETGKIDIGHYSFINLCFHVYVRPHSYRRLTLSDLQIDIHPDSGVRSYFLWLTPAKTGVHSPSKYCVALHRVVGELLEAQRIHVIEKYGHQVDKLDVPKIALFPARRLGKNGCWLNPHAQANFGAMSDIDGNFHIAYLKPITKLLGDLRFNFNGLRHTVGTQLAEAGCSAATIKAVLKHASDLTCRAYVDICFHGLASKLSESMQPGFDLHYPVHAFRSKLDPVLAERAIHSEDIETGRADLTGECGREVACQFAPIACYACARFIPCFDADHTINLDIVDREIQRCNLRGQAFKSMLERSKDARRYILLVVAATEQKRRTEVEFSNQYE